MEASITAHSHLPPGGRAARRFLAAPVAATSSVAPAVYIRCACGPLALASRQSSRKARRPVRAPPPARRPRHAGTQRGGSPRAGSARRRCRTGADAGRPTKERLGVPRPEAPGRQPAGRRDGPAPRPPRAPPAAEPSTAVDRPRPPCAAPPRSRPAEAPRRTPRRRRARPPRRAARHPPRRSPPAERRVGPHRGPVGDGDDRFQLGDDRGDGARGSPRRARQRSRPASTPVGQRVGDAVDLSVRSSGRTPGIGLPEALGGRRVAARGPRVCASTCSICRWRTTSSSGIPRPTPAVTSADRAVLEHGIRVLRLVDVEHRRGDRPPAPPPWRRRVLAAVRRPRPGARRRHPAPAPPRAGGRRRPHRPDRPRWRRSRSRASTAASADSRCAVDASRSASSRTAPGCRAAAAGRSPRPTEQRTRHPGLGVDVERAGVDRGVTQRGQRLTQGEAHPAPPAEQLLDGRPGGHPARGPTARQRGRPSAGGRPRSRRGRPPARPPRRRRPGSSSWPNARHPGRQPG